LPENIWNVDEKGFLIGVGHKMQRVLSRKVYESGKCAQSTQDGNREFITLIACISALGNKIPPALLYKGKSKDLTDTWVEDLEDTDNVYFTSTENGWTNNKYSLKWLQQVFKPNTRPKKSTTKRLLLVDGHSSYINLSFIIEAEKHGIYILILPSHLTYHL